MTKPPKSTPHSDIDGVHQDEKPNVQSAIEAGQDSGDVRHAKDQAIARPKTSDDRDGNEEKRDDRTG